MAIHIMDMVQPPGIGMPPCIARASYTVNHAAAAKIAKAMARGASIRTLAAVVELGILTVFSAVVVFEVGTHAEHARRAQSRALGGESGGLVEVDLLGRTAHRIEDRPHL